MSRLTGKLTIKLISSHQTPLDPKIMTKTAPVTDPNKNQTKNP
jgi:hypothetical protein